MLKERTPKKMIEKIINLFEVIIDDLKKMEADDLDLTLDDHVAHCAEFVREFNRLEFEEHLELLRNDKGGWDKNVLALSLHAIHHSHLLRDPQPSVSDRTVDHLMVGYEPATIVSTNNGERLSFDNFPKFGMLFFTNNFPLTDEAAIAACNIAVLCSVLGGIC
jgi:hypothetical protein